MEDILWLKELDKGKIPVIGMKAGYLADLYNNDFPVSNGFVISADSFHEFLRSNGHDVVARKVFNELDFGNLNSVCGASEKIKKIILNDNLSPGLRSEILEAYENLNVSSDLHNTKSNVLSLIKSWRGNAIVAVRSSLIVDVPGASDNFLNVLGNNNIINSVKKCWAGFFNVPNILFHKEKILDDKNGIAIFVQKMTDTKKSGIAFSNNPASRNNEILIEACFGLGQIITQGEINPDIYIFNKNSKEIKEHIGTKNLKLIRDVNTNETVKKKLFPDEQNRKTLENWEIDEIIKITNNIENFYNENFLIEFGFGKKFEIFHARPFKLPEIIEKDNLNGEILINGYGGSPNIKTGVAKNDILVSDFANQNVKNRLFFSKGLVVNSGNIGSSAALLCRQLGIPFVVAENSTALLDSGLLVTVDGRTGKVYEGDAKRSESDNCVNIL